MPDYYVGLMSGTSADGIDAAVVEFSDSNLQLLDAGMVEWRPELRQRILQAITHPETLAAPELGRLDADIGAAFGDAALVAIQRAGLEPEQIIAIGSHGQTLFHSPDSIPAFSMQIGDANRIAERTGITTVADFRNRDMAVGGQGAPLVPAFHLARFGQTDTPRAILNIGGIANLTCLPESGETVTGFDTGPGNALMDYWTKLHRNKPFDNNGDWAQSGKVDTGLLQHMLTDEYFRRSPPKSTGRELFSPAWLNQALDQGYRDLSAVDVQSTLCELTAQSIADALLGTAPETLEVFVCGGGAHNLSLMQRLETLLPTCRVDTTAALGLQPDWVEAIAFAWLARQTLSGRPGNLPAVTGASAPVILGAIHPGRIDR